MSSPASSEIKGEKSPELTYVIQDGITQDQINQLIAYTQDKDDIGIAQNTSDWKCGAGRFASKENFNNWLKKGRSVFTLVSNTGKLVGIVWFGTEDIPTKGNTFIPDFDPKLYGITYAIRLYDEARGKGLAIPYTRAALTRFRSTQEYASTPNQGVWLETNADNVPAISAYEKLGCHKVSRTTANGRILMVFPD